MNNDLFNPESCTTLHNGVRLASHDIEASMYEFAGRLMAKCLFRHMSLSKTTLRGD